MLTFFRVSSQLNGLHSLSLKIWSVTDRMLIYDVTYLQKLTKSQKKIMNKINLNWNIVFWEGNILIANVVRYLTKVDVV